MAQWEEVTLDAYLDEKIMQTGPDRWSLERAAALLGLEPRTADASEAVVPRDEQSVPDGAQLPLALPESRPAAA